MNNKGTQKRTLWKPGRMKIIGTLIFGATLLLFVLAVFVFAPEQLPPYKQRILALVSAGLAGFFGFFLTGSIGLKLDSLRSKVGGFTVDATGGVALFVLVLFWWLSPLAPVGTADGLLTIRATVLGVDKMPIEDAQVWSSLGGESKRVAGGWEFEIPESKLPIDRKLTIYAAHRPAFLKGSLEIKLGQERMVTAKIQLVRDTSAYITGIVVAPGGTPLADAVVAVVGSSETAHTNPEGRFSLPAHVAAGQEVRLRIKKPGYRSKEEYYPARDIPIPVILDKQ